MKFNVMTIVAIIFIIIMMGSTIAYVFIQAYQFGTGPSSTSAKATLPGTSIIDYELSIDQESLALSQGKTVIKYSYSPTCTKCLTIENQLEGVVNQLGSQVFLERLIMQNTNQTDVLTMTSSQNSKIYDNPTTNNIIDGMCSVLVQPPLDCTLRNINPSATSATTTSAITTSSTTNATAA